MKVIELIDIDLYESSVTEAAYSEWLTGSTYATGNTVYVTLSEDTLTERTPHEIYISLADANQGNYPPDSIDKWSLVGATNQWEMFDSYVNTQTEDTSTIKTDIDSSYSNYGGLFNLQGSIVTLTQSINIELATNGNCTADSFTKETGWAHDPGKYDCDGSQVADSMLYRDMSTVEDTQYIVKFTVSNYSTGNIAGLAGGTAGTDVAADGDYAQAITAGSAAKDGVIADADFIGSVDDISVMKILNRESISLKVDYPVTYYNYFFGEFLFKEDVKWEYAHHSNSRLRTEITTQAGTAKCGMVALGKSYELGGTRYDVQIGIADYSKKDTDALGRTYLSQGVYAKTLEIDILFENSIIDFVNRRLTALRGTASMLDANNTDKDIDDVGSMIVYGFFRDFRIIIPGPTKSKCSIEYEGLI